jgi:hypothetical protein
MQTAACAFHAKTSDHVWNREHFPARRGKAALSMPAACKDEAPRVSERGAEIHNVLSNYCTVILDRLASLTCARLASVGVSKIAVTGS